MTASSSTPTDADDRSSRRPRTGLVTSRLSRYDLVLAAIPAAFGAAIVLQTAGIVSGRTAIFAAAAVGLMSLVDALVVNPPGTRRER